MIENNPFCANLSIEASELYYTKPGNLNTLLVEKNTPASMFMTDQLLKALCDLTPGARDMVFYILRYLGNKQDTIEIIYEKYCERVGDTSLRSFYRAIAELTNFIIVKKKSRKNVYYINPSYIFKGNRLKVFPDRLTITHEAHVVKQLRALKVIPERDISKASFAQDITDEEIADVM